MKTSLKPGMILQGRYKILSLIGKGGMGFVYKVFGMRLNKEFALKEMYDHFVDPEDKERVAKQFQNEAETMAKLDHSGIPRILDTFEESERHYLVMEFVDGKTLEQVVLDNPQYLLESQVLEWTGYVLDILEYLHNRPDPVIIRDLKPANIMLTAEGKIKIIDFGIAKIFDPRDRTQTAIKGSGSAGFAPPEQYGSGGTDPRSDIYALGVTLYYLMSKVIIPDSVDRILQSDKINPPSHYNPLVSQKIDALILKMIELKPDDRFQSIAEIRAFLQSDKLQHSGASGFFNPSASTLPRTAVRMENQEVVEEWKKKQSQVTLPQSTMPSSGSLSGDRDYHFVSATLLKGASSDESPAKEAKKSSFPSFIITGMFVGCFLFLLFLLSIPYLFKSDRKQGNATPSPEPSPSPTVVKLVEKHKEISGIITKLEKSEDSVKIQVKSDDGPLTLRMDREGFPKKAKIGAEVKAEYKVVADGSEKPPWPIISMTITKSAPQPSPAYTPPAYVPPGYTPGYRPPVYVPPSRPYTPPHTGGGGGRTGGGSGGTTGGSGGLTHERPKY
jgi:serine/threonine protein kinase